MVIDFYQNQKSDCSINEQCKDIQPTPAGHLFSPALCCKRNFSLNLVIRYILTPEHWPRQSHHWTELSLKRLCTLLHYAVHRKNWYFGRRWSADTLTFEHFKETELSSMKPSLVFTLLDLSMCLSFMTREYFMLYF